jgi:hypothetical protein
MICHELDFAVYDAYLPRLPADRLEPHFACHALSLRRAATGIALRGSCNGGLDNMTLSPWLEGQSEAYRKAQLQAFASDQQRNNISRFLPLRRSRNR